MDDLRQGVTPAGHAVLDHLEARQVEWGDRHAIAEQLKMAQARARNALYAANPKKQRDFAIEAAARLIDAINEMDREIAFEAAARADQISVSQQEGTPGAQQAPGGISA